ncbi:MAG: branched-chain amino acid ABC transporter permease, partial [Hyphomicrobiales bacterium]
MDVFFEQLANGTSTGALYALLALALVFIFRATDIVNFAQGEMAMFGTYIGWSISRPLSFSWIPLFEIERHVNLLTWAPHIGGVPLTLGTEESGLTRIGYLVILIATLAISFVMGAAIERFIIRPSEGKNLLNAVIVTLGLFAVFNSLGNFTYGPVPQVYPAPFTGSAVDFGLFKLGQQALFALIVAAILMVLIFVFFQYTRLGLALRAAALNPQASQLMGVNTGRMLTLGWGIAAAIGTLSGMMVAPQLAGISPNLMLTILLYGFAAAVLGGLDSAVGAVVGGLAVGIGQAMVIQYLEPQWSD